MTLHLVADNTDQEIERNRLDELMVKVSCERCKRRWMVKIRDVESVECECRKDRK